MRLAFTLLSLAAPLLKAAPTEAEHFIALLRWESFRLTPYFDGNHQCVGLGHNLDAHKELPKTVYSQAELMALFRLDLATSLRAAREGVRGFDDLPDEVQLAIVGLVWTVGPTGFHLFKNLRLALSMRHFSGAAVELYQSKWFQRVSAQRANWTLNILRSQP